MGKLNFILCFALALVAVLHSYVAGAALLAVTMIADDFISAFKERK